MGLAAGLMAVGTAINAIGDINEGNAQASEYRYQAAIADQNAAYAAAEGEVQGTDAGLKEAATVGSIKAAQAARGVDVSSGSALKVQQSGEQLGQLDVLTIRSDAARQAYGYHTQASGDIIAAKNAQTAGYLNAAGSLFTGFGQLAGFGGQAAPQAAPSNPGAAGVAVSTPTSLIGGSGYIPAPAATAGINWFSGPAYGP